MGGDIIGYILTLWNTGYPGLLILAAVFVVAVVTAVFREFG